MSINTASDALLLILCIAAAFILIVLILRVYLVTQTPVSKGLVGAQILEPPEPPKPQIRKPVANQTDQADNPK